MGERGPAPAPTALKLLKGEQRSRIPVGEPVPASQPIVAPKGLDKDALAVWRRLAPDLERKGVLTHWDTEAFAVYCRAVVFGHRAAKLVDSQGLVVMGRHTEQRNPALIAFRDMAELELRAGSRFGLTPSDRAGLATGQPDEPDAGSHLLTQ